MPGETDQIVAEFTDSQGRVRTSDVVTCGIFAPPPTTAPPATTPPVNVVPVRVNPTFTG